LEEQAQAGVTRDKSGVPTRVTTPARQVLGRVEKLLKEVADADGEYADRARQRRAGVLAALLAERAAGDVSRLASFEECYLTAQVDAAELAQAKTDADRARHCRRVVAA